MNIFLVLVILVTKLREIGMLKSWRKDAASSSYQLSVFNKITLKCETQKPELVIVLAPRRVFEDSKIGHQFIIVKETWQA